MTRDLLQRAMRLHPNWILRMMPLLPAFIIIASFWPRRGDEFELAGLGVLIVTAAVLAAIVMMSVRFGERIRCALILRRLGNIVERFDGTISHEGVYFRTSTAEERLPWSKFVFARISIDMILLYRTRAFYLALSDAFFESEEAWRAAKEIIATHVPVR